MIETGGPHQALVRAQAGLTAPPTVISTAPGRMLVMLALNLLARTFAKVALLPPLGTESLTQVYRDFITLWGFPWPELGAADISPGEDCDVLLAVGSTDRVDKSSMTVTIGHDGWIAEYQHGPGPVIVGETKNPIGATAAACLGLAQLFGKAIRPSLPRRYQLAFSGPPKLRWSTFAYTADGDNPPLPAQLVLSDTVLVGLGGVGSALAGVLSWVPGLMGTLVMVDPDKVSESNLNRFLVAPGTAIGKHKTEVVQHHLSTVCPEIKVLSAPMSYQRFVRQVARPVDTVISTVDNEDTRAFIQSDLPAVVIDAATSGPVIGVGRHTFLDGACLGCIHPRTSNPYSREIQMAKLLGWPLGAVIERLADDHPLSPAELVSIAQRLGFEEAPHFAESKPLRVFWAEDVCGKIDLPAESQGDQVAGSAAFVSTLAGALAAGEVLKSAIGATPLDNELKMQVFQGPDNTFPRKRRKDPKCSCFCYEQAM